MAVFGSRMDRSTASVLKLQRSLNSSILVSLHLFVEDPDGYIIGFQVNNGCMSFALETSCEDCPLCGAMNLKKAAGAISAAFRLGNHPSRKLPPRLNEITFLTLSFSVCQLSQRSEVDHR